jgi:hypothetical protein
VTHFGLDQWEERRAAEVTVLKHHYDYLLLSGKARAKEKTNIRVCVEDARKRSCGIQSEYLYQRMFPGIANPLSDLNPLSALLDVWDRKFCDLLYGQAKYDRIKTYAPVLKMIDHSLYNYYVRMFPGIANPLSARTSSLLLHQLS